MFVSIPLAHMLASVDSFVLCNHILVPGPSFLGLQASVLRLTRRCNLIRVTADDWYPKHVRYKMSQERSPATARRAAAPNHTHKNGSVATHAPHAPLTGTLHVPHHRCTCGV